MVVDPDAGIMQRVVHISAEMGAPLHREHRVSGVGEALEERELRLGRQGARFGLKAVSRAHLDDLHPLRCRHPYILDVGPDVWPGRLARTFGPDVRMGRP